MAQNSCLPHCGHVLPDHWSGCRLTGLSTLTLFFSLLIRILWEAKLETRKNILFLVKQFIHLLILNSMNPRLFYFILCGIHDNHYLDAQSVPDRCESPRRLPGPFDLFPARILGPFLAFWQHHVHKTSLELLPAPALQSASPSGSPGSCQRKITLSSEDLGAKYTHCYRGAALSVNRLRHHAYLCIYTLT